MNNTPINPEKWYRPLELVRLLQRTADAILHIVRVKRCSIRVINDELHVYGKDVLDAITNKKKD